MAAKEFETIVNHAKNSGFVYQGSEIYGGLSNTWDFGPLGVELKNKRLIYPLKLYKKRKRRMILLFLNYYRPFSSLS